MEDPFVRPDTTLQMAMRKLEVVEGIAADIDFSSITEVFVVELEEGRGFSKRVRFIKPVPPEIRSQFGEITADLKHTLDQSLHAAYMIQTNGQISKTIQFPTGRTEVDFKNSIKNRLKEMNGNSNIIRIVESTQCYETGNAGLYQMCAFAGHKHRNFLELLPVANSVGFTGGVFIAGSQGGSIGVTRLKGERVFEVARYSFGGANEPRFRIGIDITVAEPGYYLGQNWRVTLHDMFAKVSKIHQDIKAAARA